MKSAKVNAKGLTVWLWLSTHGKSKKQLPHNFCDFFWSSVLNYPLAILAWPGHLINFFTKDTSTTKAWTWIFHIVVAFVMYNGLMTADKTPAVLTFMAYLYGVAVLAAAAVGMVIFLLIVAGCIELKDYIAEKLREKRNRKRELEWKLKNEGKWVEPEYKEPVPSGFITWWKSFKGKYCPKIEYYNLDIEDTRQDRGFNDYTDHDTEERYNPHYEDHNSEHEI